MRTRFLMAFIIMADHTPLPQVSMMESIGKIGEVMATPYASPGLCSLNRFTKCVGTILLVISFL